MTKLIVAGNRVGPILGRHPWVFSGALKNVPEGMGSGEPVALYDDGGRFLAHGYFNSYSQIAVRLWSWNEQEQVNAKFFENKIKNAYALRKNYLASTKTDSYRLINSENDFLPGLIVDKYADCLCLQFHTAGIEFWRKEITAALVKIIKPKGIYEKSDVLHRRKELVILSAAKDLSVNVPESRKDSSVVSLPQNDKRGGEGLLYGKVPAKVKISENGYKFWVDIIGGQKTGFFLDQRDKRMALQKYCDKKNVLNCFSYSGGFSVYALGGGAKKAVSVDASESALELAKENVKLNKMDIKKCEFVCSDVKDYLFSPSAREGVGGVGAFDIIILDPPAFVKDRRKIAEGLIGYKKINEAALRLLPNNGILVSASCSAHISLTDFRYMLSESAGRTRRSLQILETYTHGIDHPELVAFTEGEYLKCVFAKVS